jgi:hypothetical protein
MVRLLRSLFLPALLLVLPPGVWASPARHVLSLSLGQSEPSDPYVRSRVDSGDPRSHCLYWTRPALIWQQSRQGNPGTGGGEFEAVRRAFASWQEVLATCGNLDLQEGALTDERTVGFAAGRDDNRNVVLFRTQRCRTVVGSSDPCWKDGTCANAHDCWDHDEQTIAITVSTFDHDSGILRDSDIEVNAAPQGDGRRFVFSASVSEQVTCGDVSAQQCIPVDVQNTVTHEAGHLLGLDHTAAPGSTMNPDAADGDTSKRTVDPGSQDFVCTAYPRGQPSQDCVSLPAGDTLGRAAPGCSGAAGGPTDGWVLLLSTLVLARLTRRARARHGAEPVHISDGSGRSDD